MSFLKDGHTIGQWVIVDGERATFSTPEHVVGLEVSEGNFSSISAMPLSAKADGAYSCQFDYGKSDELLTFNSTVWNGKFGPPLPPTTTSKSVITTKPVTTPSGKPMTTLTGKPMTTPTGKPTTRTGKPMTTPTGKPMTTKKMPTTTMMPTTTTMPTSSNQTSTRMTTKSPGSTTPSGSKPTKPATNATTTSHHHHHNSTTPKMQTTTHKPSGATSAQISLFLALFGSFVLFFAYY